MAHDSASAVSDRELVDRMLAGRNDSTVALWLVVPALTIPVGVVYGEKGALVALFASLALCVLLLRVRDRLPKLQTARQAELEYKRRFRLHDLQKYEAEAVASLEKPDAPEVVMLFAGQGLPHGMHHFVRIDLGDAPRLQVRRAPLPHEVLQAEDVDNRLFRYDQPLTAAQEQKARDLLPVLTPANLASPPSHFVFDGFPCTAVLLRRGYEPIWTELNMGGLPPELREVPAARFMRLFIDLEAEAS